MARCDACGKPAVRTFQDGELMLSLHFCSACPDPIEVYARAARIRETWPDFRWRTQDDKIPAGLVSAALVRERYQHAE